MSIRSHHETMDKSIKPKVVVLGSCSVDFTTYAPRLPKPGETLHGSKFTTSYGGKGANQCVAAAKLGGNTFMICRVGDDQWGNQYKENLKSEGVNVSYAHITENETTGIAHIVVAENGENQIVIVPGANKCLSVQDVEESREVIKNAGVLIGQLETPFESTFEAFKICNGIKLLNAAPALTDIQKILPHCTILCVNETEASVLTNIDVSISNASLAVKKLLETGCETAIITLGSLGAVYLSKNEKRSIHVLCESVTPIDTTGAGDAFVGALATFLLHYKDYPLHQLIGAACAVATVSVTSEGTQTSYPTKNDFFSKKYVFVELE